MAIKLDAKFEGWPELRKALTQLPKDIQAKALRNLATAGARELAKEVKARAPSDTGKLRRNIMVKSFKARNGRARAYVGIREQGGGKADPKDSFYWKFLEFGTSTIQARPFIRPAADAKEGVLLNELGRKGQKILEKLLKKHNLGKR